MEWHPILLRRYHLHPAQLWDYTPRQFLDILDDLREHPIDTVQLGELKT